MRSRTVLFAAHSCGAQWNSSATDYIAATVPKMCDQTRNGGRGCVLVLEDITDTQTQKNTFLRTEPATSDSFLIAPLILPQINYTAKQPAGASVCNQVSDVTHPYRGGEYFKYNFFSKYGIVSSFLKFQSPLFLSFVVNCTSPRGCGCSLYSN